MKIEPFAMDEGREGMVIFRIDNGDDLSAYIWVDEDVRATDIYGLASYCNHAVEPFYVGEDMPKDKIDEAYQRLADLSDEERQELVEEFNKKMEWAKRNEEGYKERLDYEKGVLKDIEEGNNVKDGLFWLM